MAQLAVLNKDGKPKETIDLPGDVFGSCVNEAVIYQAVVMYQASLRQGNASTKERGQVSGGGVKPYRQKGTGRARAGSNRSPLWKGGGVVFGPHPRDFGYTIPKKIRRAALREALNAKYQSEDLLCLDELTDKFTKTKEFAKILGALNVNGKILAMLDGCDESVYLVSRNIPRFAVARAEDLNAYDVMKHRKIIFTKTALKKIIERITK